VYVDETRGHVEARDVDHALALCGRDLTHRGDAVAGDAEVGGKGGGSRPVHDRAALQHEVERRPRFRAPDRRRRGGDEGSARLQELAAAEASLSAHPRRL
jgi:hypothetical protein